MVTAMDGKPTGGYGMNTGEWSSEAAVTAIGLPIFDGRRALGWNPVSHRIIGAGRGDESGRVRGLCVQGGEAGRGGPGGGVAVVA